MKNPPFRRSAATVALLSLTANLYAEGPVGTQLDTLERAIIEQERVLEQQRQELQKLREQVRGQPRGRQEVLAPVAEEPAQPPPPAQAEVEAIPPSRMESWRATGQPVGQAPSGKRESRGNVLSLPDEVRGVLTQSGNLIVEPGFQFSKSQVNRLTFRGVEIDNFILVGPFEAENVDREFFSASLTARYGLTNRIELETKVPYIWRDDDETGTIPVAGQQNPPTIERGQTGKGIGDVEISAHYQINQGLNGWPYFIGNLRYKSRTGEGPFDISRDSQGIEKELPTGSGFHAIEPSVTILYPTDPAVLFANVGYLFNLEDDVDKTIAGNKIGKVDPGDTFRVSFGMAYSVNERLSLTVGYKHDFISSTKSIIGGAKTKSSDLDVGALLVGYGYQLTNRLGVNINLEIGATDDAPDTQITVRVPYRFDIF